MASEDKDESKETATGFNLSTSSAKFQAKTDDIFGCLSALEDKHIAHEKNRSTSDDAQFWKNDPLIDDYKIIDTRKGTQKRRAESCIDGSKRDTQDFKRPRLGPCRPRNRQPDHTVHPERWKEYSLEDVSTDDMSDKSNTQTAFAFLEDRRRLREAESDPESVQPANIEESACSKGVVTFTRKSKDKTEPSVEVKTPSEVVAKVQHSFEDVDENDVVASGISVNPVAESETKTVSFKSRKSNKRSIRSRNLNDDDNAD
ncbi:protein TSSC4-like [Gigantopelta aegis]|uniref:protein TSSC4-like n=1 Tax=Gigantopelta aegis TaxID=1735272 RepID=UPI001B888AD8|nr:protein TSSC4-like [Gigantopelta aegis]